MVTSRSFPLAGLFGLLLIAFGLTTARAADKDWPEGYEIAEKSESPDGHYGVLLPTRETAENLDEDKIVDTFVDLKTHHRIAVLQGANYFPGENHRGLSVAWAADSSWCAVTYEERYGFGTITLVEPHGAKCTQTDVGKHIEEALNAVIARQAHEKDAEGYGSAYFRSGPGREILVRGTAYTNPKSLENVPTYDAFFEGTFDLATGKWTRSEARKITSEQKDGVESALWGVTEEGVTFVTEDDRLKFYDDRLNEVYQGIRLMLSPERFAAVKKEQIAWLKKLEARPSPTAKCEFIATRIKELQRLVW